MFKKIVGAIKRKALAVCVAVSVTAMTAVSAFAADPAAPFLDADGAISPTAFDPLSTAVTSGIGVLMPKVIVIVGILIVIGIGVGLFRKYSKPGNN